MLLQTWLAMAGRWRSAFAQQRSFLRVLHHAAPHVRQQPQIVISLDDTGLPKRSRMIRACSWLRDPLGPRFQTNFIWGLRCLHFMLHLPAQIEGLGATGISVAFEWAPPPKKPKKSAPPEAVTAYRAAQKTHVGLGQAQVWSADYYELPPWRSRRDRDGLRRPSAHDLLTRLRADLAAQIHGKPPDAGLPPRATVIAA